MKRIIRNALLSAALLTMTVPASASLQLRLSDGVGPAVTITDQGPGDSAAGVGVVQYSGPVGLTWVGNVTIGLSKNVLGSSVAPALDLSTTSFSTGPGSLTIELTDTGFTGVGPANASIGGRSAGQVFWKTYADGANTQFGKSQLITSQGPLTGDPFTNSAAGAVSVLAPYSITFEVLLQHAAPGLSSIDAYLEVTPIAPNCECAITPPASICSGGSKTFTVTSGGTAPFTYLWSNGAITPSITVNAAGTYTATVTDAAGCSSTCETSLTVNSPPTCTIDPPQKTICSGASQTFTVTPAGGKAPYTYVWSSGETTSGITVSAAGTYTATVTDANGCSSTCEATLRVVSINCTITAPATICAGGSQTFTVTPVGGTAPFTYVWNTGATTPSITVSAAGTYTATVTDANGCFSTCTTALTLLALPTCSLTVPSPLPPCAWPDNQLSGPPGMGVYLWTIIASTGPGWAITSGDTSQTVTYTTGSSGTATFQLVVINANGCTSTCQVTFSCAGDSGGCRVTGGSNKQLSTYQAACITTPYPTFVSHGGQVGASHSGETPFTPYSACISGEWQHNRHLTQNSLVGTFHAAGNGSKHQYDSLLCACLPCDASPGAVGFLADLCNPNNRICGPEPRRAPANKICFSGVGDYTYTTGRKTVKAVFRVDIEDRSEGNSHASNPPPDRYRIRIWLLDPACGRNYGPDSAQGLALRLAASADPTKIINLATTEDLKNPIVAGLPDIDDGGDMTQGNHQIHPQTGSTCP